jgi:hypothetical protein
MKDFIFLTYMLAQITVIGIFLSYLPDAWVFVRNEVLQERPTYPIQPCQDSVK